MFFGGNLTTHMTDGVYWGLTALDLMGHRDALPRDKTIEFVKSCQHDNGNTSPLVV